MSDIFLIIGGISLLLQPVALIYICLQVFRKKSKKKAIISLFFLFFSFIICESVGIATMCKHDLTLVEEIAPTCTDTGKKTSRCTICDKVISKSIPELGHEFVVIAKVTPTVMTEGLESLQCNRCNHERIEKINKLSCQHNWSNATCKEKSTCSICGKSQGNLANHSWKEPTCTEPKTCTVCGLTQGQPVEHTWLDATKTAPQTCSMCGTMQGLKLLSTSDLYGIWVGPKNDERTAYLYFCSKGIYCMFSKWAPSVSEFTSKYKIADSYNLDANSACTFYNTANGKNYECKLEQNGEMIKMTISGSTIGGSYNQLSASAFDDSNKRPSISAPKQKACDASGCSNAGIYEFSIFSDEIKGNYCEAHYNEMIDMIGEMEKDVASGPYSKHTCEECSREGIYNFIGLSGTMEYYCTEHYYELVDLLESLGLL